MTHLDARDAYSVFTTGNPTSREQCSSVDHGVRCESPVRIDVTAQSWGRVMGRVGMCRECYRAICTDGGHLAYMKDLFPAEEEEAFAVA